jgi:prolyl-tRNA synthetase
VADELREAGIRVRVDDRPELRPGFKFNEWELKGVPVRVELGARDLAAAAATVARRDGGQKEQLPLAGLAAAICDLLDDVQAALFASAREERERRTLQDPQSYDELIEYLGEASGFAVAPWCGDADCEARVKADSSATIRCLPLDEQAAEAGACVCCGRPAVTSAVWAQAY